MQRHDCNFQTLSQSFDSHTNFPSLFPSSDFHIHQSIMAKKSKKTKTKAVKDATAEISEKNLSISSTSPSPKKETKDDKWELKKIYDMSQLQDSSPTMCDGNDCTLVACSQWKSSQNGDIWNACLDCQLERFQGWPDSKDEYPVEFIDEDHRKIMIQLCSGKFLMLVASCLVA